MFVRACIFMLILVILIVCAMSVLVSATFAQTVTGKPTTGLATPMSVAWIYSMGPDPGSRLVPLVTEDRVFVTYANMLRCLDVITGAELWRFAPGAGSRVITAPVPWRDLIIVGADNSSLYALNRGTGKKLWEIKCAGPISPSPLILNDLLMVGAEKMVYAIDPDSGQLKWISSVVATISAGPVSDGSLLYFLCQDTSMQCVDAATGRYRWRAAIPSGVPEGPVIAPQRVVVTVGDIAVGISRSGAVSWTAEMPAGIGGPPAVIGDTLYMPCLDGKIYTLYTRSGRQQRGVNYEIKDAATSAPLIVGELMVMGTSGAHIYALDAATGAVHWSYRCVAPEQELGEEAEFGIYVQPVVAVDSLFCITGAGDFYKFSPSAQDTAGPVFGNFQPKSASALPGSETIPLSFIVFDVGSGVDPKSVRITVDGDLVKVEFNESSGVATVQGMKLTDGSHVIKISAKDYRGNEASDGWSFLTDASIKSAEEEERPTEREQRPRTTRLSTQRR